MQTGRGLADSDDEDPRFLKSVHAAIKGSALAEDFELSEDEVITLSVLLTQYLEERPGNGEPNPKDVRRAVQQIGFALGQLLEALEVLRRAPGTAAWLFRVMFGPLAVSPRRADAILGHRAGPLLARLKRAHRAAQAVPPPAGAPPGVKSDPAYDELVRRLFRFWEATLKQPGRGSPRRSASLIYELVKESLGLIGSQVEIKTLRNRRPVFPPLGSSRR